MTVAGRSARRVDGQGGAGARRRALPARVWRTAARCGLSVWRHHHRESVVGRTEGAQPPNTAGGNITKGGKSTRGNPTCQHQRLGRALCWAILLLLRPLSLPPLLLLLLRLLLLPSLRLAARLFSCASASENPLSPQMLGRGPC